MLYEFKSRATGSVTMTGEVGARILALIGKSAGPQGIITVAQLPGAIAALEAAVAAEKAGAGHPGAGAAASGVRGRHDGDGDDGNEGDEGDEGDEDDGDDGRRADPPVSLAQRAWPLLDLFRQAHAAGRDVTWGV